MSAGEDRARAGTASPVQVGRLNVFINYRRADSGGYALLLYETLAGRFGADNVFLDVKSIVPGDRWITELRERGSNCTAFLSLIGQRWTHILSERNPEEDQVRREIEVALRTANRGAPMVIVPTLLDDADMPTQDDVPRPLWPLLARECVSLRPQQWDLDVATLIETLERLEAKPEGAEAPPPRPSPPEDPGQTRTERKPRRTVERRPGEDHYEEVRKAIFDGSVVTFLGPGANSSDREGDWAGAGCGSLPDDIELAAYLMGQVGIPVNQALLPTASQYVAVAEGQGDLYQALKKTLAAGAEPSSTHRFLARLPKTLHSAEAERHQVIVTTNYDTALEQAFVDEEEPFDLALYMASDGGRFVHFPFDGEHKTIDIGKANDYRGFPIGEFHEVGRTVIVKIHGTVDGERDEYSWQDNYVITEDDYIGYLSQTGVESVVPVQLRNKLRYSHFLFLGYAMRDWNLRVFLHRMFGGKLLNTSWAVQRDADELDQRFWRRNAVDFYGMPLAEYVGELEKHLRASASEG